MASFQRLGEPFILSVSPTSGSTPITISGDPRYVLGATNILVVNKCASWVRLKGSAGTFSPVTTSTGIAFPPGFVGVLGAQVVTDWLSGMSITEQGITAVTSGEVEVTYGVGD